MLLTLHLTKHTLPLIAQQCSSAEPYGCMGSAHSSCLFPASILLCLCCCHTAFHGVLMLVHAHTTLTSAAQTLLQGEASALEAGLAGH